MKKEEIKKILVIQTAFLGDVIMSTPILKGIKKIYRNSIIDIVTAKQNVKVLENNPYINKIISFDKSNFLIKFFSMIKLIKRFRKEKYDFAFSVQGSFTSSLMMILSSIPVRIGSSKQKFLTNPVKFPRGLHIRERIGLMLKEVEDLDFDLLTELFTAKSDKNKIDCFFNDDNGVKIGIAPGSIRETKKWPLEYFAELIKNIPPKIKIYLIGGGFLDEEISCEIEKRVNRKNLFNLTGKLTILESVELISRLDLMITNDSAPLHMANAVNTPVFAFFGPTVKEFGCYPYRDKDKILEVNLDCRPCGKHGGNSCPLQNHKCMNNIKPLMVLLKIKEFLEKNNL